MNLSAVRSGLVVTGLASVAVLVSPGNARAEDPPCFSQAAVSMDVVAEGTDGGEKPDPQDYEKKDGRVRLTRGASIVLRAPVFNVTGKRDVGWTHFAVLYTDPDGRGQIDESKPKEPDEERPRTNGARVQAVLKFIDQSGSPPQKVEEVELDSNEARALSEEKAMETRQMRVELPKKTKLNFESNYYFVEITLTRKVDEPDRRGRPGKKNPYKPDVLGFKLCKQFK